MEHEPAGPQPIKRLSKDVINLIAAAEIIHRPANAIKELIENSLDAGSTTIKVTIKEGGLKLIQITDNGHGINKSDLPLLCTRYATSKLSTFSDLQSIATYGFRGEALASISYCAHVDVVSKTKQESCGYKAHYADGILISPKPSMTADPKPAAANDGTVITAEDLFYNMPLRKRAFKSAWEEYNKILDVITKYAVHNPHVSWAGTSLPDITTPQNSTTRSNISLLYTASLASELLEVPETVLKPKDKLGAKCKGWVSNANSNWARRGGWLLFINHRLVDSSKIKKAIDGLYTAYLPKGSSPFVYLSLEIDPAKVDVNVHPTKSEVHFLNEDEMVEAVVGVISTALSGANVSRSFSVQVQPFPVRRDAELKIIGHQTLLPGAADPSGKRGESSTSQKPSTYKPAANYKVRMDPTNRTLDSMLPPQDPSQLAGFAHTENDERPLKRRATGNEEEPVDIDDERERVVVDEPRDRSREIPESICEFGSILELRKAAKKSGNKDAMEILQKHAFVGLVDKDLCLSLIQYSTKLFLANHAILGDEHFYQLALRQFGAFSKLKLEPPPSLRDLLVIAAENEEGITQHGLTVNSVVKKITHLLMDKREMIDEYFSLAITASGEIEGLPMVLRGYTPNLDRLPHFLLCLGTRVNWESEKECFETILRELAFFYSPRPFGEEQEVSAEEENSQRWQLEHVLFPSFRKYTYWPKDILSNGGLGMIANLPDLFRVFERC
ncbi:DNA mismatch repair protein MLH1, partial [Tremellales sp. Uapishka_1]